MQGVSIFIVYEKKKDLRFNPSTMGRRLPFLKKMKQSHQKIFVVFEKIKMVNNKIKYSGDIKNAITWLKNTISHTEMIGQIVESKHYAFYDALKKKKVH